MGKDINDYIAKETVRLFESGGIIPADYENNYLLPKIIISIALRNLSDQYRPYEGNIPDTKLYKILSNVKMG